MRRVFGGLAAALLSTIICSARAQSAPAGPADDAARAKARALGYAGVEAYDGGDYAAASAKLEESFQLLPVPSLGLWSARALVGLRRWVEAEQRYRAVAALAVGSNDPPVQEQAKTDALRERAELLRRIPSLKVRVSGAGVDEVTVSVDGAARSSTELVTALLVDPGRHEVSGVRGSERSQVVLNLGEGTHEEVELRFSGMPLSTAVATPPESPTPPAAATLELPLAAAEPTSAQPSEQPSDAPGSTQQALRVGGWVAVGLGASGLVTSLVTYLLAEQQYDGFKRRNLCVNGGCSQDEVDTYNTLRDIQQVSLIAGGIAAAAGTTLVVLTWDEPEEQRQVRLEVGPTFAALSGSF
jgi:hypothetical protein